MLTVVDAQPLYTGTYAHQKYKYTPVDRFVPMLGWHVEKLYERLTELEGENAKLREQVDTAKHNSVRNAREYARLCRENDRLREYAESYAKAVECEGCGWCPYDIDAVCNTETIPMHDGCKLYDELRELGIEVKQ